MAASSLVRNDVRFVSPSETTDLNAPSADRIITAPWDITEERKLILALKASEARLAEAQRIAGLGSFEYDLDTNRATWSDEMYRIFDWDPQRDAPDYDEVIAGIHPQDREACARDRAQAIQDRLPFQRDIRIRRRDGSYKWARGAARILFDEEGRALRLVGTLLDIDERRRQDEAIRRSEARLNEAQAVAQVGSWEWDIETGEVLWSEQMYELLEFDPTQGAPAFEMIMTHYHPFDVQSHLREVDQAVKTGRGYDSDVRSVRKDGSIRWLHAIGKAICRADGRATRLVGTLRDITTAKELSDQLHAANAHLESINKLLVEQQADLLAGHQQLEALATTDGLTGLKNHRAFQERVAEEYKRCRRYNLPLSALLLDVDNFKAFNDAFGHPAGDEVLKAVGSILAFTARTSDFVARYGGEEFVLLLPETDAKEALVLAERVRAAVDRHRWDRRHVTVSVGVASLDILAVSGSTLVQNADAALYAAKRGGRNRVTVFGEQDSSRSGPDESEFCSTFSIC